MTRMKTSICRLCWNFCPVEVETDGDQVISVSGVDDDPIYRGYTCVKGRAQPEIYASAGRLRHSLKRQPDGSFITIRTDDAIGEIAERLRDVLDRYGPRAVSLFFGTFAASESPVNLMITEAFMRAIGSPMTFSAGTLDQPGKILAKGLLGSWMAPGQAYSDPDVVLLAGNNPFVSHQVVTGHPGHFFKRLAARGAQLIVIDPRKTETAKRATIHLQGRPGEDVAILAGMLRVIIDEQLVDADFIAENVDGFEALKEAVAPFTPDQVARRAGIDTTDLVAAARVFGSAKSAYAAGGTGLNMIGKGTLAEYLLLCLDTVCGHWLRAGERVVNPLTMLPQSMQLDKAQALAPFPAYGFGEKLRVRDLGMTLAGMPAGGLADEILLPGEGQVRAMLSTGGNPASCVPDQLKMVEALRSLDLLVQVDVQMSPTAKLAHYVIASTLPFEMAATNIHVETFATLGNALGFPQAYAHYTPAVVEPPAGSDVLEQWRLLYRLAQLLDVPLEVYPPFGKTGEGGYSSRLDMTREPDLDELLDIVHAESRVPLDEIRRQPKAALFPDPHLYVKPKDPGWQGRLDVGNDTMMADLRAEVLSETHLDSPEFPFRLLERRMMHVNNTPTIAMPANRPRHNPAFFHPDDLAALGIAGEEIIEIESRRARIWAVARPDDTVRMGTVSMSHSFGDLPGLDDDVRRYGSNPNRLMSDDAVYDRYTGQPLMTNIPVRVIRGG